jgi:hypothetical protein
MRLLGSRLFFVIAVSLLVIVGGCDSVDKAAKKIMADQGLTLLQPARDYIALGGIVSVPGSGRAQYEDPYDTLPNENGTYSSFNAIISQNAKNQSIGIDAAVGSLGNFVTLPASISGAVNHTSSVKLSQIDTGGTRYTTQKIAALLKRTATSDAIKADLLSGVRVFVIQEVYTATSFSITSSNSTSIAAAAGGSAPSPQCSATGTGGSGTGSSGTSGSGKGSSGTSGSEKGGSGTSGSGSGSSGSGSSGTGSSGTSSSGTSSSGTSSSGTSSSGSAPISLGLCWGGNSSLSFTTDHPIPFAVRLNEVVVGPGGVLQIKKGNFKLPLNTLGSDSVADTATPSSGVLADLQRKPRN